MKHNEKFQIPNTLYLVGNGLDRNNGLDTSYKSFIIFYLKKAIKMAVDNNYPFIDNCMRIEIDFIRFKSDFDKMDSFFDNFEQEFMPENYFVSRDRKREYLISNFPFLIITPASKFIEAILKNFSFSTWAGIENDIYKVLKQSYHDTEKSQRKLNDPTDTSYGNNVINDLNRSVKCLTKELVYYLQSQNSPLKPNSIISELTRTKTTKLERHNKLVIDPTSSYFHILNFNYTTYLEKEVLALSDYYNGIIDAKVFVQDMNNIHGRLDEEFDDIIFGIGDEQERFLHDVESYYSDNWLESFKSYKYLRKNNYQNLIGFTQIDDYEIYVIGHSCSITDRTLLKMLFENPHCKKIHVMHRGMSSYMSICFNISRNFSDKIKMRKVLQPFDPKLKF